MMARKMTLSRAPLRPSSAADARILEALGVRSPCRLAAALAALNPAAAAFRAARARGVSRDSFVESPPDRIRMH